MELADNPPNRLLGANFLASWRRQMRQRVSARAMIERIHERAATSPPWRVGAGVRRCAGWPPSRRRASPTSSVRSLGSLTVVHLTADTVEAATDAADASGVFPEVSAGCLAVDAAVRRSPSLRWSQTHAAACTGGTIDLPSIKALASAAENTVARCCWDRDRIRRRGRHFGHRHRGIVALAVALVKARLARPRLELRARERSRRPAYLLCPASV
jgi:hypothetical protein